MKKILIIIVIASSLFGVTLKQLKEEKTTLNGLQLLGIIVRIQAQRAMALYSDVFPLIQVELKKKENGVIFIYVYCKMKKTATVQRVSNAKANIYYLFQDDIFFTNFFPNREVDVYLKTYIKD